MLGSTRMAEVTSSSLVASTPDNGSSATENYRTQRNLSRDPELLTATQLQPRIEFVRVPNKPPLVYFGGVGADAIKHPAYDLSKIYLLRRWVNKPPADMPLPSFGWHHVYGA